MRSLILISDWVISCCHFTCFFGVVDICKHVRFALSVVGQIYHFIAFQFPVHFQSKYTFHITFQLQVICYDSSYTSDIATRNVTISVNRNPNAPSFSSPSYSVTISDAFALMAEVVRVSATDPDGVRLIYLFAFNPKNLCFCSK